MKMNIDVTCPKCGKLFIDRAWVNEGTTSGTIDTDCPYCGKVIDGSPFVVSEDQTLA